MSFRRARGRSRDERGCDGEEKARRGWRCVVSGDENVGEPDVKPWQSCRLAHPRKRIETVTNDKDQPCLRCPRVYTSHRDRSTMVIHGLTQYRAAGDASATKTNRFAGIPRSKDAWNSLISRWSLGRRSHSGVTIHAFLFPQIPARDSSLKIRRPDFRVVRS